MGETNYCAIFLSTKEVARSLIKYHNLEDDLTNEDKEALNSDKQFHIPDSIIHGNGTLDTNSFFVAIGNDDNSITFKSIIKSIDYFFEFLPVLYDLEHPLYIEIYDDEDKLKFCPNFEKETFEYLIRSILTQKELDLGWTIEFQYYGEEDK